DLHDLAWAVVHLAGEVNERGVDRVGSRLDQIDRGAVLVAELVADRPRFTRRGEGVAVEPREQAVAVLQPGGECVGLERRGGRARGGGPVAGVLDKIWAAVEGDH